MADEPDIVERVTAAIDAALAEWIGQAEPDRALADLPTALLARAAIDALRQPTQAMLSAGGLEATVYQPESFGSADAPHQKADAVWQAMLEEAVPDPATVASDGRDP